MVDAMPDLNLQEAGAQCFPRYQFRDSAQDSLPGLRKKERVDNITDAALQTFRTRYNGEAVTKDAIFDYIYGVLHAPAYRARFASNLNKQLPRIPFAENFRAFADAGRTLADLHTGDETGGEYPLQTEGKPSDFLLGTKKMKFADAEKTTLIVNDRARLTGIPPEAHQYVVNGRTPLEWFIDRYRITRDKYSGVVNDPNAWFGNPSDFIAALRRVVYLSVETTRIVNALPNPFPEPPA